MGLVSILPGGEGVWLANYNETGLSPLYLTIFGVLTLLHLERMTYRCLYHLSLWLTVFGIFSILGFGTPAFLFNLLTVLALGAHLPMLSTESGYKLMAFGGSFSFFSLIGAKDSFLVIVLLILLVSLAHHIYVTGVTLIASTPTPLVFPIVSHLLPRYHFSKEQFLNADSPPPEVVAKRQKAFETLNVHWNDKFSNGLKISEYLSQSFSDLRFAGGNRVFLPFQRILNNWCDPCTVIKSVDGVYLTDVDNNELIDISGSYGVNVCGYEKYKEFISKGWDNVKNVGCVLGPVHPLLQENISILKKMAKKEEVSFHMSGTEAVMGAVRLVRFNTNKSLVVVFGGAYHGWWDGVQPMAGNERFPGDVLTLKDMDSMSLEVLRLRKNEIAAVVINPLQVFHPNQPPPSDLVLASNTRMKIDVSESTRKYQQWLLNIRRLCNETGIVLVFDEVYTGFRLAPGGAQEYFDVVADVVVYGKTLGGGIPNGIVCGPRWLMNRNDEKKPLRVAYVIGTFAAHPLLLGAMNQFLKFVSAPDAPSLYNELRERVNNFVTETNALLIKEATIKNASGEDIAPIKLASYSSVWTMLYNVPGRYHWMLQYYLKDEGVNLSWVGTGRLSFSLDFTEEDLKVLQKRIIKACIRMRDDGWWYMPPDEETAKQSEQKIKLALVKEIVTALVKRVFAF